jgi:hypothetical protein
MINDKIDIDNSKVKNRLVTKTWLIEQISNFIFYATLARPSGRWFSSN